MTASKQTTDGVTYGNGTTDSLMTYAYNLSGALIEQQYPSGRKVQNTLDADGSLEMVKSGKNAGSGYWNYANNFTYNAAGAVTSMQLGNGAWESTAFNSRLQPTQIALGTTQGGTGLLDLDYEYGSTASVNNGNVTKQTITVPTVGSDSGFTAVQSYSYDSLNRLKDATEMLTPSGGSQVQTWKQAFTFDRYGNRNFDEANTTTLPKNCLNGAIPAVCAADRKVVNPEILTSDNRIKGDQDGDSVVDYAFDPSGNTTKDAESRRFTYDGENKQVKVETTDGNGNVTGTVGEYWYDGDGKRVKKYVPSTGETTIFVYDAAGKLVAEYSTIVEPASTAKVSYLTNDHLGSPRINTDANGAVIARHDYHPFGEDVATSQRTSGLGYADDTVRKQFTGYERDDETDLDFAHARTYSNSLGRYTSADPLYLELRRLSDPQQINLYNYTRSNPLKFVDATGLDIEVTGETTDDYMERLQKNVSFKIQRNSKTRKVEIIDADGNVLDKKGLKSLEKSLKEKAKTTDNKAERELFKAITDTENHAVIDTVRESGDIDFGRFYGKGHNTIDSSDLSVLDNSSDNAGFTAAHVVGHETLEAYHSAVNQTTTIYDSHNDANQFFAGIVPAGNEKRFYNRDRTVINSTIRPYNIQGTNTNILIERQYITPVPVNSLPLPKGTVVPRHIVDVRRQPK